MNFPLKWLDTVSGVSLWDTTLVEMSEMELQKSAYFYGITIEKKFNTTNKVFNVVFKKSNTKLLRTIGVHSPPSVAKCAQTSLNCLKILSPQLNSSKSNLSVRIYACFLCAAQNTYKKFKSRKQNQTHPYIPICSAHMMTLHTLRSSIYTLNFRARFFVLGASISNPLLHSCLLSYSVFPHGIEAT